MMARFMSSDVGGEELYIDRAIQTAEVYDPVIVKDEWESIPPMFAVR